MIFKYGKRFRFAPSFNNFYREILKCKMSHIALANGTRVLTYSRDPKKHKGRLLVTKKLFFHLIEFKKYKQYLFHL